MVLQNFILWVIVPVFSRFAVALDAGPCEGVQAEPRMRVLQSLLTQHKTRRTMRAFSHFIPWISVLPICAETTPSTVTGSLKCAVLPKTIPSTDTMDTVYIECLYRNRYNGYCLYSQKRKKKWGKGEEKAMSYIQKLAKWWNQQTPQMCWDDAWLSCLLGPLLPSLSVCPPPSSLT